PPPGFGPVRPTAGGRRARFAASSELSRRAREKSARPPLPVLVHSPGHVAATDEQAKAEFWPRWRDIVTLIAPERGFAIPTEESFDWETGPHGALYVGSPETVAEKIATNLRALVLRSLKDVHKAPAVGAWFGLGPSPDPGPGAGVELGGGDLGGVGDLVGVSEGLPGQGGLAEDPPPAFLQVQPAGALGDEGVPDAGMAFQPGPGVLAVVAGEVIGDDHDLAGRVGVLHLLQEPLVMHA